MIYLFITIILQLIFTSLYTICPYSLPIFFFISIPFLYFIIDKRILLLLIIFLGIIYDILYSDIFLLNTSFSLALLFFLNMFYNNRKQNIKNFLIISIASIIIYDILNMAIYKNLSMSSFINKLSYSFFINFIFYIISFIVLKSRIFSNKIKINY